MSTVLGPRTADDPRTAHLWQANLDALRKSEWPWADALAAAEPVAGNLEENENRPPLPEAGNLFVDPGRRFDRLAELLDELDIHQSVYVLDSDLAALAAGLRQADLSVAIGKERLHLFSGDDPAQAALDHFHRNQLSAVPDHLLTLTADEGRFRVLRERATQIVTTLLEVAVGQLTETGAISDPYAVARLADEVLTKQPGEPTAAAHLANSLRRLGIDDPAIELMDAVIEQIGAQPELTALREQLQPGRGRVDLASRRGLFEANLAALRVSDPDAADIVDESGLPDSLVLFRDVNLNYQCGLRTADGWHWAAALNDHRGALDIVREQIGDYDQIAPNQMVCGVSLGGVLRAAYDATARSYYEHKGVVYVVEPRPWWVRLIFHLNDWTDLLAGGRVLWFLGSGGGRRLVDLLRETPQLNLPKCQLVLRTYHDAFGASAPCKIDRLRREFSDTVLARQARLGDFYGARDPDEWTRIFSATADRPPRVLSLTTRHSTFIQHSTRDMLAAFAALGCETRMLIESDDRHALTARYIGEQVEQFRPDLVMVIDHHRHEYKSAMPAHVPFVCWIQDRLPNLFDAEASAKLGSRDYTVGHCRIECCTRHGYDSDQFLSLPVFTSADRYHDTPIDEAILAEYACDVSFVSHCPESHDEWFAQQLHSNMPEPLVKLMTVFYRRILAEYEADRCTHFVADLVELLREVEQEVGFAVTTEPERWQLAQQFWRLSDRLFRQSALKWLIGSGLDVRLYGHGWENHPTLASFARGVAENGEQLRAIYQASRINLQVVPYSMTHQRLLDGVAGGGFFLVRHHPNNTSSGSIRAANEYVRDRGFTSTRQLLNSSDPRAQDVLARLRTDTNLLSSQRSEHLLENLRLLAQSDYRWYPDVAFEDLAAITFRSKAELLEKVAHFLADEPHRREIAERMRNVVAERFELTGGMRSVLDFLRDRIAVEPSFSPAACGGSAPKNP